jgi:hypothetical protein
LIYRLSFVTTSAVSRFGSFGKSVSEENIFRNRPIRNKNCLWRPCLSTDRDEMSNLNRRPSGCNVCNSRIQKLSFFLFLIFFPTWIVVNVINFGSAKVFQWVPRRHKVLTHGQERFFRKVCKTPNVVYLLDCHVCGSQYVGESVQPFNKRMNGHRSDLTKKTLLPVSQHFVSPVHSLEDFCRSTIYIIDQGVLQLTYQNILYSFPVVLLWNTWFTLADRRWRSRCRSSDQCILNAFRSPERYNGHVLLYRCCPFINNSMFPDFASIPLIIN